MTLQDVRKRLRRLGKRSRAALLRKYFQTGPGGYAEGDAFLGVPMAPLRRLARQCDDLRRGSVERLLQSPWHEERMLALLILVRRYGQGDSAEKRRIYRLYFRNTPFINNWDLVDLSAHPIVGAHLEERSRDPLFRLAESSNLWERRIAVLATLHFIRRNRFTEILRLAAMLLDDEEDLIHKAVGWMLREVGKRNPEAEERFLLRYGSRMPRTMLRYAIERFAEPKRRRYLSTTRAPVRPSGS